MLAGPCLHPPEDRPRQPLPYIATRAASLVKQQVGKLTDLYPLDAWQAALCDEVMEVVEDINTKLAATFFKRRGGDSCIGGMR